MPVNGVLTANEVRSLKRRAHRGDWDELDFVALCDSHEALRSSLPIKPESSDPVQRAVDEIQWVAENLEPL